jgi:hypothetical protein
MYLLYYVRIREDSTIENPVWEIEKVPLREIKD